MYLAIPNGMKVKTTINADKPIEIKYGLLINLTLNQLNTAYSVQEIITDIESTYNIHK